MSASQAFAQAYAEQLQYRTTAKVTYYGSHTMETQGLGRTLPSNTVRLKHHVTEITLTFGFCEVTLSSMLDDGKDQVQSKFVYADNDFEEKLEKALVQTGIAFVKTQQQWEKHKRAS